MNIISFSKTFGRFGFHFDIIGALALGFGLNFFHSTVGIGASIGPFVVSLTYTQPQVGECPGGHCAVPHEHAGA